MTATISTAGNGSASMKGRTCLVSGGGNGLGRAIATALATTGARVIVVGRDMHKLHRVAEDLTSHGGLRVAGVDVADPTSVDRLREQLADEDISVLVNNAGIAGPVHPLVDIDPADWDEVFDTNVRGVFLMCRAFAPDMVQRGRGDIINIASVSGKRPLVNRSPYCASKMAVIGLTRTLAAEIGPRGVAVNSLSPGPVAGARIRSVLEAEAARSGSSYKQVEAAFVARSVLGRMVGEDEVGQAVLAMLRMPGLAAADIDLSAGMVAP